MLFDRVAAACNIRRQITGRGRGQLITDILSVQADAVPDQLLFAEAVKSVMFRDPFPACAPIDLPVSNALSVSMPPSNDR